MDETQAHLEPSASELLSKYLRRPGVLLPLLGLVTFVVYWRRPPMTKRLAMSRSRRPYSAVSTVKQKAS